MDGCLSSNVGLGWGGSWCSGEGVSFIHHHHHHHLLLKCPFLPCSARVRHFSRYEASPLIPEHCPFRVQAKLNHIILYTFSPSLPPSTLTSHPRHHHISTGRHPIISTLMFRDVPGIWYYPVSDQESDILLDPVSCIQYTTISGIIRYPVSSRISYLVLSGTLPTAAETAATDFYGI